MGGQDKLGAILRSHLFQLQGIDGAALIEFAVALPLLVVLAIGIFDFGGAFNLKQELNNAAREGARFGASQPTNDILNTGTPPTIDAVRYLVASYLQGMRVNDCGLSTMPAPGGISGPMTWTYSTTGTCARALVLTITHPCISPSCPAIAGATNVYMPDTYVQISYPYQWHFNNVIQLLVPGANYAISNITTDATAANMN
ncbi:MAG TPA: TadE/TadG family type IV pilus assembly protein [Terriglobales bacterium]|jgi:Flp pilus assembly protein TadG|nr:TadE/TadG family type IV pilus assembly protein [Terriglobales bacterium]